MDPALQEQLLAHLDRSEEVEAILRLKAAGQLPVKVEYQRVWVGRYLPHPQTDIREVYRSPMKASLKGRPFLENAGALFPGYSRQPAAEQAMGKAAALPGKEWSSASSTGDSTLLTPACVILTAPGCDWDQGPGALLPYGYGALYRKDEIDDALQTEKFSTWRWAITLPKEPDGHRGAWHPCRLHSSRQQHGQRRGIAPEASTGLRPSGTARDTEGAANLGDSVRILEALDFIRHMAARYRLPSI